MVKKITKKMERYPTHPYSPKPLKKAQSAESNDANIASPCLIVSNMMGPKPAPKQKRSIEPTA